MNCTPIFERNFDSTAKIVINRGGTRSSKTYSIAQLSALWLMTGTLGEDEYVMSGTWSTVRKYRTTLDNTVIKDFEEIMHTEGWYSQVKHDKTRKTYKYKTRVVEFIGADDEQKLRGSKRKILYCNEANELGYKEEFFQLLMRTEHRIFLDFNPDDEDIWINTELEKRRAADKGDVEVIVSNYRDNTFLSQSLIEEIEYLEDTDPEFWKIYGLGQYGNITGLIYEDVKIIKEVPTNARLIAYGVDFGYTNDPTVVIGVSREGDNVYIQEVEYSTGLTNQDITERITANGLDLRDEYICDSAEPKSIEELYRMGVNAKPAVKGKDSIVHGIQILKRYNLHVTENSLNVRSELRKYKWMVDRTGRSLNKPVNKFNHAMDAIRYVALIHLNENLKGVYHII